MKKLLFSFIIVAAGLFVTSCGNKSAESATEAEQTEQVAEEAPAAEAEQPASLADIVAKAKAEGANWSADEWKAQFKTALEAYKPFAVAMNEAQPAELEEVTKKYADGNERGSARRAGRSHQEICRCPRVDGGIGKSCQAI